MYQCQDSGRSPSQPCNGHSRGLLDGLEVSLVLYQAYSVQYHASLVANEMTLEQWTAEAV